MLPDNQHHAVGKETGETAHVERWNTTLRQRVGRFVRQTLSFSKSLIMHEIAVHLFLHHYNLERTILGVCATTADITTGAVFQRLRAVGPRQPAHGTPRQYRAAGALSYSGRYFVLTTRFQAADLDPQLAAALAPHSTRHTFITLAIRGGASIAKAQAAARHADPRTTMRYAHDMDDLDDHADDYVKL